MQLAIFSKFMRLKDAEKFTKSGFMGPAWSKEDEMHQTVCVCLMPGWLTAQPGNRYRPWSIFQNCFLRYRNITELNLFKIQYKTQVYSLYWSIPITISNYGVCWQYMWLKMAIHCQKRHCDACTEIKMANCWNPSLNPIIKCQI